MPSAEERAKQWAAEQAAAEHERKLHRAARDTNTWKNLARVYMAEAEVAKAQQDALLGLSENTTKARPIEPLARKGDRHSDSTACFLLSDLHVDETVKPAQVPGGKNRYSPGIAEERLHNFARNAVKMIDSARASTEVHQAVLFALGDNFSGWIHEELLHSTNMTPIESVLWLQSRFVTLIDYLLEKAGLQKLHVLGMVGNHSRITHKEYAAPATSSLEFILYRWLASHYHNNARVCFQIPESKREITTIGGVRVRWVHGNQWGFNKGVGGVTVPMQRFIKDMQSGEPADFTVCGHWHTFTPGRNSLINGSLIGYTAYSSNFGPYEPPQQAFFLISSKHRRVTMQAPVFVE